MLKVSDTTELQTALVDILAYSHSTANPSRRVLVAKLQRLTHSIVGTAVSLEDQHKMLKAHPPKIEEEDGSLAVMCYSPFVHKYIPMMGVEDKDTAEHELAFWEKDHKRILKTLKEALGQEGED